MTPTLLNLEKSIKEKTSDWFEKTIHDLSADKLTYETSTLNSESKGFYEIMASGDVEVLMETVSSTMQKYFFTELIRSFINELFMVRKSSHPKKLAFDYKGKQIMIWVEIPFNDEKMEDNIFLSEAVVNYKFINSGFNISTTIVEDSDRLAIPPHYINFEMERFG